MNGEIFRLMGTIGLNNKEANKGIDETTGKAQGASTKIAGFFQKAAVAIGAAFAVQKLVNFGKMTVEAAASAQAIKAQFEQVFGENRTQATDAVNAMAEQFGMLPNRIMPSFTALTSKFKGLGMTTEEAMAQATTATNIAADAAAFYDKSMEESQSALNSFVNGSYEAGESIGLFANETQLAGWAAQNLGVDWNTLDEAGKQVARLEFAKAMQEAAGATGQASRESDSYENQLGNMKQAWSDFAALVGAPILDIAVQGLQTVTGWLQIAGGKVQEFQAWFGGFRDEVTNSTAFQTLSDVFQQIVDKFSAMRDGMADSGFLDTIKQTFTDIKDAVLGIDFTKLISDIGAFLEQWAPLIAGVVGGYIAFQVITAAVTLWGNAMLILQGIMFLVNNAGAIMAGVMGAINWPIVALVAAIGLLVAAGVWLYQNWDTVSAKAKEIWGGISSYLSGLWSSISSTASTIWNGIKTAIANVWNSIKATTSSVVESIKTAVSNAFNAVKSTVSSIFNSISSTTSSVWSSIKSTVSNAVNGISSTVSSVFNGVKSTVSGVWDGIKSKITGAIDGAKNAVSNAVNAIKGFMNFSWSLPKLKLPKISISGSFSLAPPSVPKFGIDWFADGGILTKAMAFGMNGNDMMVGGEAGKEAVLPLNRETLGGIGQGIASAMGWGNEYIAQKLDAIIDLIAEFLAGYDPNTQLVMDTGTLVGELKNEMDKQLGNDYRLRGRGR